MGSSAVCSLNKTLNSSRRPKLTNKNRPREWKANSHRWSESAEVEEAAMSALPRHQEEARQKQMTRFRLFILLTNTALLCTASWHQYRDALRSHHYHQARTSFLLLAHSLRTRGMMVTNPSSFVNSSRERSLSSTLSYPSLRSV